MKALLVLLAIGLLIYAVIDCSRTPESAVPPSLPRAGWLVVVILLPIVGPIFWLLASRTEDDDASRGSRGPTSSGGSAGRGNSRGPVGPDDDPDFLHGL